MPPMEKPWPLRLSVNYAFPFCEGRQIELEAKQKYGTEGLLHITDKDSICVPLPIAFF